MTTRHVATLHVTDSNGGIHDIVTIEVERLAPAPGEDEVAIVTMHNHNGKREWRFSGAGDPLADAWIAALRMTGFGDFKRDLYESA